MNFFQTGYTDQTLLFWSEQIALIQYMLMYVVLVTVLGPPQLELYLTDQSHLHFFFTTYLLVGRLVNSIQSML